MQNTKSLTLKNKDYLEGEIDLISFAFTTSWAIWKARNNFIFGGESINPGKIISLVQNICEGSNTREHGKVFPHPLVTVGTSLLKPMDKILVFTDAAFNTKDGKSSYGFFMMKYNKPLVAGACFGPMIFFSKEA